MRLPRLLAQLVFVLILQPDSRAESGAPNVIFALADDLGYSDVGCYGASGVKTPHIDRLAAEGLHFTDFHTAASICSPSRAAFLTGAYPQRCGLYTGINPRRTAHWFLGLNPDELTLAEQFKKQGYKLRKDVAEAVDVAAQHPEVVQQLLGLAAKARGELGEYRQRGSAQRPTGSVVPDAPIISHEKDWGGGG
ncbi:MAG: hypothetical protein ACI8XO_004783 [Verrucomicrobiales bacterium]|jgi:hypothetical protein